jgi:hypothetical protein
MVFLSGNYSELGELCFDYQPYFMPFENIRQQLKSTLSGGHRFSTRVSSQLFSKSARRHNNIPARCAP